MLHNLTGMFVTANKEKPPDPREERKDSETLGVLKTLPRKIAKGHERYMPFAMVLPLDAARREARSIINRPAERGFVPVVQEWMQLADGLIHFTVIWIKIDR